MKTTQKIFTNGNIFSCSAPTAKLKGFSVSDGRIEKVFSRGASKAASAELIDLGGRTVFPGFTDAHLHLLMLAETFAEADLTPSRNEEEAIKILRDWSTAHKVKPGAWVKGRGFSFNDWQPPRLPSLRSLDAAFPNNPVYTSSKCGHQVWVNSQALKAAGLQDANRSTLEKWGTQIEYFPDGKPSGILKENAESLVYEHIPDLTENEKLPLLQRAITFLNRLGVLSVHTMEFFDSLELLIKLARTLPRFSLRAAYYIPATDFARVEQTVKEVNNDKQLAGLVSVEGIKVFVDGSLGGRTAWVFTPYEGEPENYGIGTKTEAELTRLVYEANKRQLVAAVHAIGDRAVLLILQVFQKVADQLKAEKRVPIQNRIEHYQLVNHDVLKLSAQVKPVLSMEPLHLAGDWRAANAHWGARSRYAYAFASALATKAPLVFGSDAPVESPNPWWGIASAVNRQDLNGEPAAGWYPEEKISLDEAVNAYTCRPPAITRLKNSGQLIPGNAADFVILDADPFNIPASELKSVKVLAAYFNGEKIFSET